MLCRVVCTVKWPELAKASVVDDKSYGIAPAAGAVALEKSFDSSRAVVESGMESSNR
jgi:hypothetical protein